MDGWLRRMLASLVYRAVVKLVDPTRAMQTIQVAAHEPSDDLEHFEPYGFTAHPPTDAEALVLGLGSGSHAVVLVAADRRQRKAILEHYQNGLAEGEVMIYNKFGARLFLGFHATELHAPDGKPVIIAGDTSVNGTLTGAALRSQDGATTSFIEPDTGKTLVFTAGILTAVLEPEP